MPNLLAYEMTPIADLKSAERNARNHGPAQLDLLADSLSAFGVLNPPIIDENNRVVSGHGRIEAAKRLGLDAIPTLRVGHLTDSELRLYALADNRLPERSTWNDEALALEMRDLRIEAPTLDLSISGFDHPKIEVLISRLEQTDWSDLDSLPEENSAVAPISELGNVWDFPGGHVLACGDSTSPAVVATTISDERVRLVATDFPYNLRGEEYSGKGKHKAVDFKMAAGEMSTAEFRDFLSASFAAVIPHLEPGALLYGFMDWRHIADLLEAGERQHFELKNLIVWDKGKAGMGALYRSAHELIALFKYGNAPHVNNIMLGKHGRDRHNIWRYAGMNRFGRVRDRALALHGTVKSVEMICDLLLDASNHGDVVFDGFGGSGTMLVAAHKMGRRAKTIELDPQYCDVAVRRFMAAFDIEPTERGTGLTFTELQSARQAEHAGGDADAE